METRQSVLFVAVLPECARAVYVRVPSGLDLITTTLDSRVTAIRTRIGLAAVAGGFFAILPQADCAAADMPRPDQQVYFGNCTALARGPVCLLPDDGRLLIWVSHPAPVTVTADNRPVQPQLADPADGGTRYTLEIPADARRLKVSAGDAMLLDLAVDRRSHDETLTRAWSLLREGQLDEAEALLGPITEGPHAGETTALLGRIALSRGETDAARHHLERAMDINLRTGEHYAGLRDATVLSYLEMHKTRRFDRARIALQRFVPPTPGHAESRYFLDNFLGLVAINSGDARSALAHLQAAVRQADRMGWDRRSLNAGMVLAVQLQQLGRRDDAIDLLESWRHRIPADSRPCERADYYTNLGWTRLLLLETGARAADPTPDLTTALTLYQEHCSADSRVNGWINLALAAFHAGHLELAAAHLESARNEIPSPELRMLLWSNDIDARIALARGDAQLALTRYHALEALASATLSPSARWRAAVGRAAALDALGQPTDALAAYAEAEQQLDGDIFRVPLDAGRESLMAARDWATRRHIDLALRVDDVELAFDLTRRARARVLRSVSTGRTTAGLSPDARQQWERALAEYATIRDAMSEDNALSWSLPADELARLEQLNRERGDSLKRILDEAISALGSADLDQHFRPARDGELVLAFHPLAKGWAAFARSTNGLEGRVTQCPDNEPAETATCLIATFADAIDDADTLRLLPIGALRNVDFHALRLGDDVLTAKVAVTYGADLAESPRQASVSRDKNRRALIVADPRGDLAAARTEAARVATALDGAGGWSYRTLSGEAATDRAVRNGLAGTALFHYAGHARFLGPRGWDSELALAGDSAFSVSDILAMDQVPATVILSGCETARTSDDTPPETIGLANAFLAAGSTTVVAATRPVNDTTAQSLVQGFYAHWSDVGAPEALRRAQLALREKQPDSDWAAFRLVAH